MDVPDLEVEIKIEYNESFEIDPLRDANINSPANANTEIERSSVEKEYTDSQTCGHNVKLDVNLGTNYDNTECNDNDNIENATENEVTWYESVDEAGRFLCKFCELKYSTLQTLRYHIKTKHPIHANILKENVFKKKRNSKLICHICKQRFKEILLLKTHVINSHSLEDMKMSCLYCDATFRTENDMSEHLFVQHKVINKPIYTCSVCGYRTSTKSHYSQHRNIHLTEKTKKCQYCDYATNYLPNLKIHERIHTNEKVYACDFVNCGYQCSARSALRSHQLKHYPDQNALYCDKCSYKTIYRQCLKRHIDSHTRNNVKLKLT